MSLLIAAGLFIVLMAAISYAGYRHYARPARYYEQLGTAVVSSDGAAAVFGPQQDGILVRVFRQVGEKVPVSPAEVTLTRRYLIAAGYRSDAAVQAFYGIKLISCIVFLVAGYFLKSYVPAYAIMRIIFVIGAGLVGYFGPNWFLDFLVKRRQETLKLALPDALDLMVVCVEAGLGLDQAILSVSRELEITHKDISDEFRLVTLEMQAGKRRADALRNLADRTGETELRKLVAILIQTDRFGTSMAESLRTHSDFMRVRRRQEAEERANKVGVKLVFPIFFCIMPAIMITVAGPGLLAIFKNLFPMMRQFSQSY